MTDGRVMSHKTENADPAAFPGYAVEYVLSQAELDISEVDHVAFLGKPLSYFERLIDRHTRLFPFSFPAFFSDFRDFFIKKLKVKSSIKENLDFSKDIYYVELADAVAYAAAGEYSSEEMIIAVFLSDCLSLRTGGCYRKKGDGLFLLKELVWSDSLSIRRGLEMEGSDPGEAEKGLRGLMSCAENPSDDRAVLVSDCRFFSDLEVKLQRELKDLSFRFLDYNEIMEYAGRYVFAGIGE